MQTNGHAQWDVKENSGLAVNLIQVTDDKTLLQHWPWLKTRLALVRRKDKYAHEEWTPDHVREAIRRGFTGSSPAKLFLGVNTEGVIEGFVVTTLRFDPFVGLPKALVAWILFANESLIDRCLPQLIEITKRHFLTRLEFLGSRKGWYKKAARFGFKPGLVSFVMEIPEDAR